VHDCYKRVRNCASARKDCAHSPETVQVLARLCKTATHLFATVQAGKDGAHSSVTVQVLAKSVQTAVHSLRVPANNAAHSSATVQVLSRLCTTATHLFATVQVLAKTVLVCKSVHVLASSV
jgi:hypothetical protein